MALGRQIGSQSYTPYTGQRVARISGNEAEASRLAGEGSAQARDYYGRSASMLEGMNDPAKIQQYMNPYLQSVLDPALRETGRAFDQRRTQVRGQAGKVGAFGGDRQSLLETQLDKSYLETVGDMTGRANFDAYENATARMERASQAWRDLGGDVTRMNAQQIQDLMLTGGVERLLDQAKLDFDYQQFTENRDWNIRNLTPLLASLQVPASSSQTDTTKESGGQLGQILGAAVSIGGAFFTGGASLAGLGGLGGLARTAAAGVGAAARGGSPIPGTRTV